MYLEKVKWPIIWDRGWYFRNLDCLVLLHTLKIIFDRIKVKDYVVLQERLDWCCIFLNTCRTYSTFREG